MTRYRLLLDGLGYHGRAHLAVGLGSAIGAAVLAGALLVGDSLRGSLRDQADRQLDGTTYALNPGRFFREQLAAELPGGVRPVIMLQGTVTAGERRAGKVTVIAVDTRFGLGDWTPKGSTATASAALGRALNLQPGAALELTVQKTSALPQSSPLARRDTGAATKTIALQVAHVLPDEHPASQFTLRPGPGSPVNLIVPLATLQREIEQPERVNVLLSPPQSIQSLQTALEKQLSLEDWGLKVHIPPKRQAYISVESRRLLLEPAAIAAARKAGEATNCAVAPTFVYLANSIAAGGQEIPYSVVAAIDPADRSPLNPVSHPFADDEIVLVDWRESPLKVNAGDPVTLTFFKPEIEGRIEEAQHTFRLRGIIPLQGAAIDPNLVPDFPGITDKLTIAQWDPPFPYDNKRIKPRDERYWQQYQATPKAYVTLAAGRKLWGSRFGDTTSVRLLPQDGDLAAALPTVDAALRQYLDPARGGFVWDPVAERASAAGQGSTDFGMLFLAFSFFLIAAALMLVGLLFRLNLERRAREVGLLRATGYSLRNVRQLLLLEGLIVASLGSLLGLGAAIGYAAAMLKILTLLWPTPGMTSFLALHVAARSLAIGFVVSVLMSLLAIWWALRGLSRIEPAQLLKGLGADETLVAVRSRWGPRLVVAGLVAAAGLIVAGPYAPTGEPQAGMFFGGGAMLLLAVLALVWTWLKRPRHDVVRALPALAARNTTRNPLRSLLTAALLAAAAFLLVAVESFRRAPGSDFLRKDGGSGGFSLLAEADSPLFIELNGPDMLSDVERDLQRRYQREKKTNAEFESKFADVKSTFSAATAYPFRVKTGDDASCLNLYQAARPRILGVPPSIVQRGGFRFSSTDAQTPEEKANPWLLLNRVGDAVPAFVEENTAIWQLKKGLGDVIEVPDEEGRMLKLRLVGLLKDSIFQSELLIADAAFRESFPRLEGFSYFLIDVAPTVAAADVERALEDNLGPYGIEVTPTSERVASYLAVQNTYLSTFQLLGGFGLLLGVVGLAVVLLRNVWERRAELALLRAVGYRTGTLNRLVFMENALLLALGLGAGAFAAIVAVTPHVASGGSLPWARLAIMLLAVTIVGLAAAAGAVAASVRTPIVAGLRHE